MLAIFWGEGRVGMEIGERMAGLLIFLLYVSAFFAIFACI